MEIKQNRQAQAATREKAALLPAIWLTYSNRIFWLAGEEWIKGISSKNPHRYGAELLKTGI